MNLIAAEDIPAKANGGVVAVFTQQMPKLHERVIAEVRLGGYSIRTLPCIVFLSWALIDLVRE